MKIFGIGYGKTGTTSLGRALQILGLKVKGFDEKLLQCVKEGNIESTLRTVEKFDAFRDLPWCFENFYITLHERFPGSKFILTIRETESWFKSQRNFWFKYFNHKFPINEDQIKSDYEKRNEDIKGFFTIDLLIINICQGDGWEKLCHFLNRPIPEQSFPHLFKGDYRCSISLFGRISHHRDSSAIWSC